jgi:hypothetical protein
MIYAKRGAKIRLKGENQMLDITAGVYPTAPKPITTKHLAYELAEQHQLTKRQSLDLLDT